MKNLPEKLEYFDLTMSANILGENEQNLVHIGDGLKHLSNLNYLKLKLWDFEDEHYLNQVLRENLKNMFPNLKKLKIKFKDNS